MASDNKMNDGTSFHHSDKPILCANGCGFFGTAATMNLCSKCYRDCRLKEEHAASAKAAVEKSMKPQAVVTAAVETAAAEPSEAVAVAVAETAVVEAPKGNRCGKCNKKVGVMGFQCRCGCTFCGSHRYPEEHHCAFDFKGIGRDALAKANPVVKADKVERF